MVIQRRPERIDRKEDTRTEKHRAKESTSDTSKESGGQIR